MAEELSVTKSSKFLSMVTGAGAKYSLTGAIFAITTGAAALHSPLTLAPRTL